MFGDDAPREAAQWIDNMKLPCVKGHTIDLRGPAQQVKFAGYFRERFFQEAVRLLKRGGASVIPPE
jgi:hypothetical protein